MQLAYLTSLHLFIPPFIRSNQKRPNHVADATEKRLINEVYDFAKSIAELQLTESELALYSALVLLQPGKSTITTLDSQSLNQRRSLLSH